MASVPAPPPPAVVSETLENDLTIAVASTLHGEGLGPKVQDGDDLKEAILKMTRDNVSMMERVLRNANSYLSGCHDADVFLKSGIDDCKAFCEDPFNGMRGGIDYDSSGRRLKISLRALAHFGMTRTGRVWGAVGLHFRDGILRMMRNLMEFYQHAQQCRHFDVGEWQKARTDNQLRSQQVNAARSEKLLSGRKKKTRRARTQCNKQARVTGADLNKAG